MVNLHLILGGARSGKSRFAEERVRQLVSDSDTQIVPYYLATATAEDDEMITRIRQHQQQRNENWRLIEEPIELAKMITDKNHNHNDVILIDCLTLWLSNCLHKKCWPKQKAALLKAVEQSTSTLVMVSNEVGSGIIPMGQLSREFVDESGRLHQDLASIANTVTLVVAGLPLSLK